MNDRSFSIQVDGADLETDAVLEIAIENGVDMPSRAEIHVADPDLIAWIEHGERAGKPVTITVDDRLEFDGVLVSRRVRMDPARGPVMMLLALDAGQRLTGGSISRVFSKSTLESVAKELAARAGLRLTQVAIDDSRLTQPGPLVQYEESDLDFLIRLSQSVGGHLWFDRGELSIGRGPGTGTTCALDITSGSASSDVGGFHLTENWSGEPLSYALPIHGAPFEQAERMKTWSLEVERPVAPQGAPAGEADTLEALGGAARYWTASVAQKPEQQGPLARAIAADHRSRRLAGAIHWTGEPRDDFIPGAAIKLTRGTRTVARGVIFGLRRGYRGPAGQVRDAVVQIGQTGPYPDARADFRPARHLWIARVAGPFDRRVGTIEVAPIGWYAGSKFAARVTSAFAGETLASITHPQPGDIGLIGFESGSPDAPVWLGALHDGAAPDVASKLGGFRFSGDELATWAVQDGMLTIDVKSLGLEISATSWTLRLGSDGVKLTAKKGVQIESEKHIQFAAQKVSVKKA